ncbi:P-loop containing nucleoside triphosphate hydrolase protein [Peniophora sp. CONT]|nr:P-loop containing nucleoside triphosphate hydrolase protein [Peniophora sp. CONT]
MIAASLTPAVTLWFSGRLLEIAAVAVEKRAVNKPELLGIACGRVLCAIINLIIGHVYQSIAQQLQERISRHYSVHAFHALARLDVPTFDDPVVSRQLDVVLPNVAGGRSVVAFAAIGNVVGVGSTFVQLLAQSIVLLGVLRRQRDGLLLAGIAAFSDIFAMMSQSSLFGGYSTYLPKSCVWAATTRDEDYLRIEGYKRVVASDTHRKEIIASGLGEYMANQYREMVQRLGNRAGDFYVLLWAGSMRFRLTGIVQSVLQQLPQIAFTLRATQYPSSIPVSMASLALIQQSSSSFMRQVGQVFHSSENLGDTLGNLRKLYEADKIPNRVQDGVNPFPENAQSLLAGVGVEFRNVSFSYPGTDKKVLQDVSFKVLPGQLCVIVGANGSGKSTVLKLCSRIYDSTEGSILIDGHDIRTLKLTDLRRAMAVLFQDYTHFPLSIRDNIALGSPEHAHDDARVREAARLAGADEIIERQPGGYGEYLNRPVRDYYSDLPEGTKTLFGRTVEHDPMRRAVGGNKPTSSTLSGGQMQRLAVARTFMRSLPTDPKEETKVGLLLFDEPSASLDPKAEHDLFARLRELRGNKTMIFSTHRFGNLTRHADIILYMDDSVIVEAGTHHELLKRDGEYARLWNMQAQAFL